MQCGRVLWIIDMQCGRVLWIIDMQCGGVLWIIDMQCGGVLWIIDMQCGRVLWIIDMQCGRVLWIIDMQCGGVLWIIDMQCGRVLWIKGTGVNYTGTISAENFGAAVSLLWASCDCCGPAVVAVGQLWLLWASCGCCEGEGYYGTKDLWRFPRKHKQCPSVTWHRFWWIINTMLMNLQQLLIYKSANYLDCIQDGNRNRTSSIILSSWSAFTQFRK